MSKKLRDFPRVPFSPGASAACAIIESALVWSEVVADLFPESCRRRVDQLVSIPWHTKKLPKGVILNYLLPYVIDRWSAAVWMRRGL